jgi:predicted nucleic acid-binding protein
MTVDQGYLLETTILTICLDSRHPRYNEVVRELEALPSNAARYVSVIGLAELEFGANLAQTVGKADVPSLREKLREARTHAVLDITHHTASAYADTKAKLAVKYLASTLRRDRPRYLEDWVDKTTGKALGVDENDLWMCAQAKERDIILVTADRRIYRISEADPDVRLLLV